MARLFFNRRRVSDALRNELLTTRKRYEEDPYETNSGGGSDIVLRAKGLR